MSGLLQGMRGLLQSPARTTIRNHRPWLLRPHTTAASTGADEGHASTTQGLHATSEASLVDKIVPRNRFGSSIFPTPLLLVLRLFYQASPFDVACLPSAISSPRAAFRNLVTRFPWRSSVVNPQESLETLPPETLDITSKIAAERWHPVISSGRYPLASASTIVSMTWVKSLSAPLSHEYLQFIVECRASRQHYRAITERDTDGDWVYIIAGSSSGATHSSGSIDQLRSYDYQHDLPLPLLSASWSNVPIAERPTILELAAKLQDISQRSPIYNLMREHCWWYAEAVFELMVAHTIRGDSWGSSIPVLKHWPFGIYRYSYIVLGKRYLRRNVLLQQAKSFKKDMDRNGRLNW